MTAPTHIAFSVLISQWLGLSWFWMSLGAFLPEIDHTRSIIGRLFPSICCPIHTFIGHRMIAHSLLMWAPLTARGG